MFRTQYSHSTTQTIIVLFFVAVAGMVLYVSNRLTDSTTLQKRAFAQDAYEYIHQTVTNEDTLPTSTP